MSPPLASLVFWAAAVCCLVAEIAIVRSTALARDEGPHADARAGGIDTSRLPRVRRGAEVTWAVLPALALAGVLAWTWQTMQDSPATRSPSNVPAAADSGRSPGAVP